MEWLSSIRQIFESALPFLDRLPAVRAILGFIIVFFLPGFAWTLVFFKQINPVERIALSLGLSIAMVTLSVLALNVLLGIRITGLNSLMIIVFITAVPLAFYFFRKLLQRKSDTQQS
ncbi:DUF1616 domain-containing protein [Chloroflexota bacterium]